MAVTNPLALMWARRQIERLQRAEIRRMAADLRDQQRELELLRRERERRRKEAMRQDGPTGFVMRESK